MIIILLGLGIWAVDRWSIWPIFPAAPIEVVPAEASVVITLPEMEQALQLYSKDSTDVWQRAVLSLPGIREDLENINLFIDTLFPSRTVVDRTDGLVSLVPTGENQLAGTWIIDLRTMGNFDPEEWLAAKRLDFQSSSFRGQLVWTVKLGGNRQIALTKIRNLLILGQLPFQVEAALAAKDNPTAWITNLNPSADLEALYSIYLHPQRWKELIDHLFSEAGRTVVYDWAKWVAYGRIDIYPLEEGYRLEGVTEANGQWLDNQVRPASIQSDLWGMLPANTAGIKAINLEDHLNYFREHNSRGVRRFQRFFLPWMDGPLLELTLRPFNAQLEDRQIYFFGYTDESLVKEAMNEWMEEVGVLQNVDYQGFLMTQVYESESLFPFSEENWSNPWWTFVGDYVVLATNRNTLENWIDQYVVGNALPLTEAVRQITLSESSGQFSFFLDWKQWRTGWQYLINDDELADAVSNLGQLALRIKTEGHRGSLRGEWLPLPVMDEDQDLSWRVVLANQVTGGPWLGTDADGNPLIIAQDATNRMYVLDESGKIKWQQALESQILSEVKIIELQQGRTLTFNTATAIHLMSLSGNEIDPFPLRLRNSTELSQTVIDFSANKNYSFFVVSTDGCVYGYELDGGPVPAWNPFCELGKIQQPLLHFQTDNKDYLVLQNTGGKMQAFARDGSLRLQAEFPSAPSHSSLQWQSIAGREQVVSCTDSGLVEVLPLAGDPIQYRLPVGDNLNVKMVYEDFQGDSRRDYLLSSGRFLALHAYTNRGLVRQFEQTLPQQIDEVFDVAGFKTNKSQIGILLKSNAKIYLLSGGGETLSGFPLAGTTPFFITDLFQAGEPHLIVGYQDEILAYRLPALQ